MFDRALAELKESLRLRIGLSLVVAVLWFNAVLSLRDQLDEEIKLYGQLAGKINRAHQYAAQKEWPERAKQARMVQAEMEGRLWHSSTPGMAQAAFQDWLTQGLTKAAISRQDVTLARDGDGKITESGTGLWKIKAKLSLDFSPKSFNDWASLLAAQERQVAVEKLNVHMEPLPRVEAILVAPFELPAQAAQPRN